MTMIGIDLGTTNSLVSFWNGSAPQLIPNVLGKFLTPSVISVESDGQIYIGEIAKQRLITHPQLSIANFKRKMGTKTITRLNKHKFSPEELSGLILKQLKTDAEVFLDEEVCSAVISVPAYFNDAQRKATKLAGEFAGLKVERLINEPTAAAIAYGIQENYKESNIIVIDLGGGTFDVSVLELFEGVMEVHSSAGDNYLGGEDFSTALRGKFLEQHQLTDSNLDKKEQGKLGRSIDELKQQLTEAESAVLNLHLNNENYQWTVSRSQFETISSELIRRLRHPVERAIRDAKLDLNELDEVILVGGATRMPLVRNLIARMFRRLPSSNINPDEVVALGAAVQTALVKKNKALEDVVLTDVCPYTLGVEVSVETQANQFESGHFLPVIERNTTIPVSKMDNLLTISDKQEHILCNVYQGESRLVANNIFLGKLDVKVPKNKAGQEAIDIRFTYNINGILEVEVKVISTDKVTRTIIKNAECSLTDDEIRNSFVKLSKIKIHPRESEKNKLLLAKAERLYEESLGEKRQYISQIANQFEVLIETQNLKKIEAGRKELDEILQNLEENIFE